MAIRGSRVTCHVGWSLAGEENEAAVADADRAEHREAVFGQTCPIETVEGEPADRRTRIWQMASSGGDRLLQHAKVAYAKLNRRLEAPLAGTKPFLSTSWLPLDPAPGAVQ